MDKAKRNKVITLVAIAVLVVAIVALLILLLCPKDDQTSVSANRDPNAALGSFEGKSQEEIQAELNRVVEEGMFNISINPNVVMATGSDEAELRIENIAANHYLMRVEITLDDTGEALYTSGMIEPGYYLQAVPLNVVLEKGIYAATAVFTAYDMKTEDSVGQAAAKITIKVEK